MNEVTGTHHTSDAVEIDIEVNGVAHTRKVEPRLLLSDFLRQDLGLKGTHVGCEHGVCGACNVLINGATARSCLIFASQLDGAKIETVESLGRSDKPASAAESVLGEAWSAMRVLRGIKTVREFWLGRTIRRPHGRQ
jgi:aerobic-type carbon monoxide dehydrogenase small subunit (CoxS/CutS family)